ncbi:condensation domain-containing protein, partial [Micromonospora sp. DT68]
FDLAAGPVFRTALGRLAPDDHVLVLVAHHIVADGWSVGILTDELAHLYAAETGVTASDPLPGLAVQPADHAVWQRARLDDEELGRQLDRWRMILADLPTLDFPTDRPRPAHPTGAGAWAG